jgi:hypothetical protein
MILAALKNPEAMPDLTEQKQQNGVWGNASRGAFSQRIQRNDRPSLARRF